MPSRQLQNSPVRAAWSTVAGCPHLPCKFESLFKDVKTKVFDRFGDETVVYSGHGDDTTLGAKRPSLSEWLERGW
jgi:hypothetical protein